MGMLPTQEQIDAVADVFAQLGSDPIASQSAIITTKMLVRALAPTMRRADRTYDPPVIGADWRVSAGDKVSVALTLSLSRHVPGWVGATDEQLAAVAADVIDALDKPAIRL